MEKIMEISQKITYIADYYGYEAQSRQLIEEMAELTVAINKYWRSQKNGQETNKSETAYCDNLVEEMVDVAIMLMQMFRLLNVDASEWYKMFQKKLDRQIKRIIDELLGED